MKKFRFLPSLFAAAVFSASLFLTPIASVHATDLSITVANVASSGDTSARYDNGKAGETILAGQPVYRATSDNRFYKADSNAATPAYKVAGIALHSALQAQPLTICTSDPNFTPGGTLTVGGIYVLSATAGGIAPVADLTTGWNSQFLFVATTTTKANFSIVRSDAAVP
jgi:hypothetical protein